MIIKEWGLPLFISLSLEVYQYDRKNVPWKVLIDKYIQNINSGAQGVSSLQYMIITVDQIATPIVCVDPIYLYLCAVFFT